MEKAKRVVWRLLAASVCVMAVSQAVHADSLDEQRSRYAQIKQAWDNKQMDTVQALMPTLGYFLGTTFSNLIDQFDHWVAFILLAIIGVNMVREALSKDEDETNDDFGFKTMLLLAIATSIDALAVGVTFALEGTDISAIKTSVEKVATASQALGAALYQQQASAGDGGAGQAKADDEDVVDAEIIDEDETK